MSAPTVASVACTEQIRRVIRTAILTNHDVIHCARLHGKLSEVFQTVCTLPAILTEDLLASCLVSEPILLVTHQESPCMYSARTPPKESNLCTTIVGNVSVC